MRNRMSGLALLIALGWLGPVSAQSEPVRTAEQWVDGIQAAVERVTFSGIVVYQRDGQLDALTVQHDGNGAQLQRLTGPELPSRVVGGEPDSAAPGPHGLLFARSGLRLGEGAVSLKLAYQTRSLPDDRVAGRSVKVVDLLARDSMRYSRRLWIDEQSGVPLRSATFGADGQLVEQWMFADISLQARAATDLPATAGDSATEQPDKLRLHAVPPGFSLVSARSGQQGEHWVYCDGLARVSVFIEPARADRAALSGLQRRGLLSVFGRVVAGRQVVVVGEVPPATVERFAQEVVLDRAG